MKQAHTFYTKGLPISLGIIFLLGSILCAWLIWERINAKNLEIEALNNKLVSLTQEKDWLQHLLKMEPCEAKTIIEKEHPKLIN